MSLASQISLLATKIANTLRDNVYPRLLPATGGLAITKGGTGSTDSVSAQASLGIGRNLIVNGNFSINQRARSGTVGLTNSGPGRYGHDHWSSGTAAATYTFAAAGIDTTITLTAGTLQQVVEGALVEGGSYTLSWAGTAQARVAINGAALSGGYAASPITVTGATAGQPITVEFSTGTIGLVQLVPGSVAAPATAAGFLRRPHELYLCQRYYTRVFANGGFDPFGFGVALTSTQVAMPVQFPREMMANPTVLASGNFFLNGAAIILFAGAAVTLGADNTSRAQVNIAVSGATPGQTYLVNAYSDSTAYIEFAAEA